MTGPQRVLNSRDETLALLRERIVAYAASRVQKDAAEDLAQEVLVVLHEKYPHVGQPEDLVPLAFEILRFKMMSMRRKLARRGEYTSLSIEELPLGDPGMDPEIAAQRRETRARLVQAVAKLGSRCRAILAMKLEGKSFVEIQAVLGAASVNTVYTWDLRCRKELLELMGGHWERRP